MRVVIIGAGNVATVLGKLVAKANHEILQVVSRNIDHAQSLATELGCAAGDDPQTINTTADLYVIAVSDAALKSLYKAYFLGDKLVVHTAGAVPADVLKAVSANYGVMYPLQSLRKENREVPVDMPLLIDGNSEQVISMIRIFAASLSSRVVGANDEERLKLHIAAVIVSNFTNHLYTLAADYCEKEGLDFSMLQPLIEETALRLRTHRPGEMQTGPAIRKDIATIDMHLQVLSAHPSLQNLYRLMTESIMGS